LTDLAWAGYSVTIIPYYGTLVSFSVLIAIFVYYRAKQPQRNEGKKKEKTFVSFVPLWLPFIWIGFLQVRNWMNISA
jgi:hypothetical protein